MRTRISDALMVLIALIACASVVLANCADSMIDWAGAIYVMLLAILLGVLLILMVIIDVE